MAKFFNIFSAHSRGTFLGGAVRVIGVICLLAVFGYKYLEAERKKQEAERLEAERKKQEAERLEAERKRQEAERLESERKKQEAEPLEAERKKQEAERLEAKHKKQDTERQKQEAWRTSPKFNKYWDFAKSEYSKFKMLEGSEDEKDRAARKEIAMKILGLTDCKLTKTWLLQCYNGMQRVYVQPLSNEEVRLSYLKILKTAYGELCGSAI